MTSIPSSSSRRPMSRSYSTPKARMDPYIQGRHIPATTTLFSPENVGTASDSSSAEDIGILYRTDTPVISMRLENGSISRKRRKENVTDRGSIFGSKDKGKSKEKASSTEDWERMKGEIETLRTSLMESRHEANTLKLSLAEQRRQGKKQYKAIEQLKGDKEERDIRIETLENAAGRQNQLINSIESNLQCQICIEILSDPYALAPCGHILCYSCLRAWFTKPDASSSTSSLDSGSMIVDDETGKRIKQRKTCPTCRAHVTRKPTPVFLVKNLVSLMGKSNPNATISSTPSNDPWAGFFPDSDESEDESEYATDSHSGSDASDGDVSAYVRGQWSDDSSDDEDGYDDANDPDTFVPFFSPATFPWNDDVEMIPMPPPPDFRPTRLSNLIPVEPRYVRPHWEPPAGPFNTDDEEHNTIVEPQVYALTRRGCPEAMIDVFKMTYSHEEGIIAFVHSNPDVTDVLPSSDHLRNNRLFLGWNIHVRDWDIDGEDYIYKAVTEYRTQPSQWRIQRRQDLTLAQRAQVGDALLDLTRLVPEDSQDVYDTSDSEVWVDC